LSGQGLREEGLAAGSLYALLSCPCIFHRPIKAEQCGA